MPVDHSFDAGGGQLVRSHTGGARGARAASTLRDVHSAAAVQSITDADALLAGSNVSSQKTAGRAFIDLFDIDGDTGEGSGHFANDQPFPNDTADVNDDNFAFSAPSGVVIPSAGAYTFGTNSDDGSRVRINPGGGFVTVVDAPGPQAPTDTFGSIAFPSAGTCPIEPTYFEASGTATLERFAAQGDHTEFDATFRLFGETANRGGLAVTPEPGTITLLRLGAIISRRRHRSRAACSSRHS